MKYFNIILCFIGLILCEPTNAKDLECNTIKLINPFGIGSGSYILEQIITERLEKGLENTIITISKPGGNPVGSLGGLSILESPADGCTLGIINDGIFGFQNLPYAPVDEHTFSFISLVGHFNDELFLMPSKGVVVTENNKTYTITDLKSLVEYARRNPNVLNYAATAPLASICMDRFLSKNDIKMVQVPYKLETEGLVSLIQGTVQLMCVYPVASRGMINSGDLKPVATVLNNRDPSFPDAPTLKELGLITVDDDNALDPYPVMVGPKNLNKNLINKISGLICDIMKDPDIIKKINDINISPKCSSPEETISKEYKFEGIK